MDCPLHWRHVSTCYRVICAYCAYVTIRRTLGDTRCTPRHFVNKVSVRQFSAENKQQSAEFYSQHFLMHSRDVIWKIKPKSTFPVSFSLVSAEMNLVGNYRTLRGLRTVNPEGFFNAVNYWEPWSQYLHGAGCNTKSQGISNDGMVTYFHCDMRILASETKWMMHMVELVVVIMVIKVMPTGSTHKIYLAA